MSQRKSRMIRAATVVLALAGGAFLLWWQRAEQAPHAGRAEHAPEPAPEPGAAVRARVAALPDAAGAAEAAETMSVGVFIRRPDDSVMEGVTVRLIDEDEVARAVTGADGVARFPSVPATRLGAVALERWLGSVSPQEGKRWLEYTCEGVFDLVVHVTCDGEPRLPEGLRVSEPSLFDPVYDAERAEVRGRFVPVADGPSYFFVSVRAPGYTGGNVIRMARSGYEAWAEAKLRRTRRVTIDVKGPTWALGLLDLEEPGIEGDGRWVGASASCRVLLATSQIRYHLRPGRYRVRLRNTPMIALPEFLVDREDLCLSADLTGVGRQEILLRAPVEVSMRDATLREGARTIKPSAHGAGYARFSIVLDGGHAVELESIHPLLEPAAPLRLVSAGAEVAIDLRLRPLLRLRLPEGATGASLEWRTGDGAVAGANDPEPFGDGCAFVAEPGRYHLRVYVRNRRPIERDIDVPPGGVDLGLIPLR